MDKKIYDENMRLREAAHHGKLYASVPVPEGERTFSEGQLWEAIRWLEQKQAEDSIVTPWAIFTFLDGRASPVLEEPEGEEGRTSRRLTAVEEAIWGRYHGKHRDVGLLNTVNYLAWRVDALESPSPAPEKCGNCGAEHSDPIITDDVCRGLDDWSAGYERGRAEAADEVQRLHDQIGDLACKISLLEEENERLLTDASAKNARRELG